MNRGFGPLPGRIKNMQEVVRSALLVTSFASSLKTPSIFHMGIGWLKKNSPHTVFPSYVRSILNSLICFRWLFGRNIAALHSATPKVSVSQWILLISFHWFNTDFWFSVSVPHLHNSHTLPATLPLYFTPHEQKWSLQIPSTTSLKLFKGLSGFSYATYSP